MLKKILRSQLFANIFLMVFSFLWIILFDMLTGFKYNKLLYFYSFINLGYFLYRILKQDQNVVLFKNKKKKRNKA